MAYRVAVRSPGSDIVAWSSTRLPFEPKGELRDLRRDLAAACRTLVAGPDQLLHAVYSSADVHPVDLENVLTYNLGTGAVRAAARHGLLLERRFAGVDQGTDAGMRHHYRYRLTDRREWAHWTPGPTLAEIHLRAPAAAFAEPRAGRWWLLARRGALTAHVGGTTVPHEFALRVTVRPPRGWRGSLTGLLKPLTDGLVAAMHAHEGDPEEIAGRAATVDRELTAGQFHDLLAEPEQAPLGRLRLVVPWRTTLQWLPADDRIVALDVRLSTDGEPGTVHARATAATATSETNDR